MSFGPAPVAIRAPRAVRCAHKKITSSFMPPRLPEAGFEMYYYDQLGCCNSDVPEDKSDMSLWTLPRYLEEVEEVRKGLGLEEFVLLGHSWGGILGIEYALKHQHEGHLKALVVSNMVASVESFLVCSKKWKKTLPPDLFERVEKIEREGDWGNPAYERIMMVSYHRLWS
jgi:proline iminopeptidase